MNTLLLGTDIQIGEGLLDSIVAIIGVFLVLIIIILAVQLLSLFKFKKQTEEEPVVASAPSVSYSKVDENDSDMMAAVLVASIDFYDETKQAPQVMGVREIK